MKIRCLIIDDKPLAIDLLSEYIGKIPFLELCATSTNPLLGLELIKEKAIDLVFLDIQMPQLSGIQFIKLAEGRVKVILTTAYSKYALDGYEHDVIDYLLKPIPFERFYQAAVKAWRSLQQHIAPDVTPSAEVKNSSAYLFVKTEHRIQKITLQDVLFIEGLENYVSIQTATERVLSLQPLKKMEEQLPLNEFVRVHRSFIVALKHIAYIERSNVIMVDETVIPIGISYRNDFFKLL